MVWIKAAPCEEKERIRRRHLIRRNEQLTEPSVLVKRMEKKRFHNGAWYWIYDLMRDGESLADELSSCTTESENESFKRLSSII